MTTDPTRSRAENEVLEALNTRPGATAGYIAAAVRRKMRPVHRILEALSEQGLVDRVPLPTGHVGYRARDVAPASRTAPAHEPTPTTSPGQEGLRAIARLFNQAGFTAAVTSNGHLQVDAITEKPPAAAMQNAAARLKWLESFVSTHFGDELTRAVEAHLSSNTETRLALEHDNVIIFDRRARRLGFVTVARVYLEGYDAPFEGNFLAAGPHWGAINDALEAIVTAHSGEPVASAGLHRHLPEGTDDDLQLAALDATRRLRHDRTRVFTHDVRIDIGDVSLVLSPLTLGVRPLELPFVFIRSDGEQFAGAIQLTLTHEPLRCVWHRSSDPDTLALAWTMTLAAYADLTCPLGRPPAARPNAGAILPSRTPGQTRGTRQPRTMAPRRTESAALPPEFRPLGATRFMASYVAGHRRRLQPGQVHSPEAAANAAAFEIHLRAQETWVQPHVRGVPSDAVLHFAWIGHHWMRPLVQRRGM